MTDAEARLKALLNAEPPPARDPFFRIAVMERMARRRLQRRLAILAGAGVAGVALLALFASDLARLAANGALPVVGGVLGLATAAWAMRQMRRPI
jgi:hypothetical protein